MRKHLITLSALMALLAIPMAVPAMAAGDLYIYTWDEYTPPELVEKFENKYDINVHIDTYDSNEIMLAKLKAGATKYDIVVPGDYMIAILIREGLIAQVNPHKMSNFGNVEKRWRDVHWDPGRKYSIPWVWGTTAFVVDSDIIKGDPNTLKHLFDPEPAAKGKINMLRDVNDVINAALRYLYLPRCNNNPDDLKKLMDLLEKQKDWVMSYSSDAKELLVSGEAVVSMSWSGYAMLARDEKPSLVYAYPKEGYTGWMDNLAVPKTAPNLENAKLFMNFMMEPEHAAMVSNYARYSNGIKGSEMYMNKELLQAPEVSRPKGTPEPEFVPPCDPEVIESYDRLWTKLLR